MRGARELGLGVHAVPARVDRQIADLLRSLGVEIDALTPDQERYLGSWE